MRDVGAQQDSIALNLLYLESPSPGKPYLDITYLFILLPEYLRGQWNEKGTKELIYTQR